MQSKKWKRKTFGNQQLATVKNPLGNYIENQIMKIDTSTCPSRPQAQVNLSFGDPTISEQFRTHQTNLGILQAKVGQIDGEVSYQGLQEARNAILKRFHTPTYKVTSDNVFIVSGGSLALWGAIMLLAQKGDNYLSPAPGFPLGAVVASTHQIETRNYHLQPDKGWKANLAQMESLIDEKTKFVLINDPSNPLGTCWTEQHKLELIDLCRKKKLPIIADEIYEGVTYGEPTKNFEELAGEDVTIFKCSGLTKRYFGPGWRLGWLIVYSNEEDSKKYIEGLRRIYSSLEIIPHTVFQCATKEVLDNENNEVHLKEKMQLLKKKIDTLSRQFQSENYCKIGEASGALYATLILNMELFSSEIPDIVEFCKKLYLEENIMVFPGKFFASEESFIRMTITCPDSVIEQFAKRFKRFSKKYLKQ